MILHTANLRCYWLETCKVAYDWDRPYLKHMLPAHAAGFSAPRSWSRVAGLLSTVAITWLISHYRGGFYLIQYNLQLHLLNTSQLVLPGTPQHNRSHLVLIVSWISPC